MEPTLISPRCLRTKREADALLFSEPKFFTSSNTFTTKVATGPSLSYTINTTTTSHRNVREERVLFLAGLMNGKETFAPVIDLLLDKWTSSSHSATTKLVLVAYDSRGTGGSSSPWGYSSTHTLAMDALALMDALGWEKAHIVGPSLGGMIAQELAIAHPERVSSLTLMLTSRGRFSMGSATEFIWGMVTTRDPDAVVEKTIDFFYPREILSRPLEDAEETVGDVLRRLHRTMLKDAPTPRPSTFVNQVLAIKTHLVSDERLRTLGSTHFPITIMGCADDKMIPGIETLTLWSAIGADRARLVFYDKAGHCVLAQCPDEVTQEIFETICAGTLGKV